MQKRPVSKVVLDSSALIALVNQEPGFEQVEAVLQDAVISAVNFAEVVAKYTKRGLPPDIVRSEVDAFRIEVVPFDRAQATMAGLLRFSTSRLGLGIGDRSCLALGLVMALPVMTADRVWARLKAGVEVILIR